MTLELSMDEMEDLVDLLDYVTTVNGVMDSGKYADAVRLRDAVARSMGNPDGPADAAKSYLLVRPDFLSAAVNESITEEVRALCSRIDVHQPIRSGYSDEWIIKIVFWNRSEPNPMSGRPFAAVGVVRVSNVSAGPSALAETIAKEVRERCDEAVVLITDQNYKLHT